MQIIINRLISTGGVNKYKKTNTLKKPSRTVFAPQHINKIIPIILISRNRSGPVFSQTTLNRNKPSDPETSAYAFNIQLASVQSSLKSSRSFMRELNRGICNPFERFIIFVHDILISVLRPACFATGRASLPLAE